MKIFNIPIRGPICELAETAPEFMRQRPAVLFYPVYKKTNSKGLCPIYCRITYCGQRADFSTGITCGPKDFNKGVLLASAPGHEIKSGELLLIENELQQIYLHLRVNGEAITSDKIKRAYQTPPQPVVPFFDLVIQYIDEKKDKVVAHNTIRTYEMRKRNIAKFFKEKKLLKVSPKEIRVETMCDFEKWMRAKNLSYIYINKHLQIFDKVMQKAFSKGLVQHNPMSGYEYSQDPPKQIIALTKEELKLLEGYKFVSEKLQRMAHLYIFGCYTSFAYCDMVNFDYTKHTRIIEGKIYIDKSRQKSHIEQLTPLFKKAKEILEIYQYKLPIISLQKYNDYLSEIADIIGIDKHLTTHTARKTFAMIGVEEGYTFDALAKMMGHRSTKYTENTYAKVTHRRIVLEMKYVNKNKGTRKAA